ncbi:MAG TPA: hypothetical protein DEW10_07155 [Bifidobacterium sp.]|nr:hypothetical protein [Bifidobacterium sp.]
MSAEYASVHGTVVVPPPAHRIRDVVIQDYPFDRPPGMSARIACGAEFGCGAQAAERPRAWHMAIGTALPVPPCGAVRRREGRSAPLR